MGAYAAVVCTPKGDRPRARGVATWGQRGTRAGPHVEDEEDQLWKEGSGEWCSGGGQRQQELLRTGVCNASRALS